MHRAHLARSAGLAALTAALIAAPLAVPATAVTGTAEAEGSLAFTARLDIGDGQRACSGALVDREWILTAASCFADDPAVSLAVPAGSPKLKTTATIGRTDLTTTAGVVRNVVEVVAHPSRDAALVRLNRPVTTVAPVAVSATPAAAGEELKVAGYGRTKTEWAPLKLHSGSFTVDAVSASDVNLTGKDGVSVCMGDTGGPALRVVDGQAQLVAVNSRSAQAGCFGIDTAVTSTAAVNTRVDDLRSWIDAKLAAPRFTDFNCDGAEDVAIGDPKATVGGDTNAGVIRVVYGDGKGTVELNQDQAYVPGGAEASDWYGESLATFDHNEDGCTDLVVGVPAEDITVGTTTNADAGSVQILYGAKGGIGTGQAAVDHVQGLGDIPVIKGSASEAGDRFGHAVAAGHTAEGEPYLLIGVPGEDLGTVANAGSAIYVRGSVNVVANQEKAGYAGDPEANDRFGASLAGSANHLVIGSPGEAIGTEKDAGGVQILKHALNADKVLTPVLGFDQDADVVSGGAEPGDQFGSSLAAVAYRPSGAATATDSIIAIGTPGEDLTVDTANKADAGAVHVLRVTAAGAVTQVSSIQQEATDVAGAVEAGDKFGTKVVLANTAPRAVVSPSTLVLAVGIPGEALGSVAGAGAVQTFYPFGAAGAHDHWIQAGDASGLGGTPTANHAVGTYLGASATRLYVGVPAAAPYGAAYALPWGNATGGRTGAAAAATTYKPGTDGLPAAGGQFGRTFG
ncbi:trypsin-like serine protease [Streptomyces sp. TRM76323]|uniref:Trypsin-like serine protease n=1 Tax=Streptomyces tamarix TaxID=3078565 RepID=A0ABU3QVH9_9ACTN|nr:trypsin-like serine protease [Streptomyces tamarix]MDT9686347.1 trypsin-like serine protease [Streptomyces tamarix]